MSNGKILVVDDEPQIRRMLRSALTKLGYVVADARSGEDALEKIRDERYDLIVLDRNMPGIGGLAACREIRSRSDVGIIMLTVRKAEPDKIEALDAGADDYVTKPFSMLELSARIRANLRRVALSPQEGPQVVTFDAIEVNLGTRHASVQGQDIRLTPKEFEVLHYLIANALALTILGPIIFNIVCIHLFMVLAGLPLAIVVTVLWLLVAYSVRSAFSGIFQRLVLAIKDGAALFAQHDVIRTLGVETKSAKAQITDKAKAMEMLEDDPGSSSAQMTDSR